MDLIQIMKALGDETRLRILNLLNVGELCVCEIEYLLDINQSNASRHLNKLTVINLIAYEKRALYVYYSINKNVLEEYPFLSGLFSKEINKLDKCKNDLKKLDKYKKSGITCEELKEGKICFNSSKEE
jgi:ArsR family transcriptional regulator, arsenate/arsenite/antimonite-responsive transcriptional repressor